MPLDTSPEESTFSVRFPLSRAYEFGDFGRMSNVTNLRQNRKQSDRAAKRAKCHENAARFGQSKAAKVLAATQDAKSRKMLDQHLLDDQGDG